MSYTIKLLPIVLKDLQAAKRWYNEQKNTLGDKFKKQVDQEIRYISEFPEHYQKKYKELRQSQVKGFPYSIFYLLEEEKQRVVIFGVLHNSRNPDTIRNRRK